MHRESAAPDCNPPPARTLATAQRRSSRPSRQRARSGRYASAPTGDRDAPAYAGRSESARLVARTCSSAGVRAARQGQDRGDLEPRTRTRLEPGVLVAPTTRRSPQDAAARTGAASPMLAMDEQLLETGRPHDASLTDRTQRKHRASHPQPSSLPARGKPAALKRRLSRHLYNQLTKTPIEASTCPPGAALRVVAIRATIGTSSKPGTLLLPADAPSSTRT
jgi:hypothetical protein